MLRQAADRGAQIACLPELFRTQYFCQTEDAARFDLAEPIPGPTTSALSTLAKDTRMVVVGSIFERRAAGLYHNTAVVIDSDGTLRGRYRKMHIPDDPLYYEKYYFTPGDLGFQAFDTAYARVGTLVCWDQWYPEAARLTALKGAEYPLLSHGDRLAPRRKSRVRRRPGERLGNDAASPCHRERSVRGSRQPDRSRRALRPAAWNSGAAHSWPIRSGASSPRLANSQKRW